MSSFLTPPRFVRLPILEAVATNRAVRIIDQDRERGGEIECFVFAYGTDENRIEKIFAHMVPSFYQGEPPAIPGRLVPVGQGFFWFWIDGEDVPGLMHTTHTISVPHGLYDRGLLHRILRESDAVRPADASNRQAPTITEHLRNQAVGVMTIAEGDASPLVETNDGDA
ncbi:MAG: hypothetical protein K0U36_03060 [Alphaproteobacteria bacterium]|nr:hypothetical protein [Alphaproteobacteria bacterium]